MSGYILNKPNKQLTIVKEINGNGGGTGTVDVPAGSYVVGITLKPTEDEIVDVSDVSNGGTELEEDLQLTKNVTSSIAINKKYDNNTTIYIAGIVQKITATLYYI